MNVRLSDISDFSDIPDYALSPEELQSLERLNTRLQVIRDRTRGVAEGWSTGLYLWGEGGIGKTYTVVDELNRWGVPLPSSQFKDDRQGTFSIARRPS